MDKGDIDRFLEQLSPAQETVVLLKEIRDGLGMITRLIQATLEQPEITIETLKPEDILKDIMPQETPFLVANAKNHKNRKFK